METAVLIFLVACIHANEDITIETPISGWTTFEESVTGQRVYVSNSLGDDANTCLSPEDPCQSITEGRSRLRNGQPDWLLLRRGDTWTEARAFFEWDLSGESAEYPMVIGSYGDDLARPIIQTGNQGAFFSWWNTDGSPGAPVEHLAIVGLHFLAHEHDHISDEKNENQGPGAQNTPPTL